MKLAVFVPTLHAEEMRTALFLKSVRVKLVYHDSCSFTTSGEGRFRALEGANPFLR